MTDRATKEQLAAALMRMTPATAGADFYNQVMPRGQIQAPSMMAFDQAPPPPQGMMQAQGQMGMQPPMQGNAALAPEQPVMNPDMVAPIPHDRPPQVTVYTIRKGDTLTSIAKRFGTTPEAIAQKNGIRDLNKIIAGRSLKF